jgi:hypothetical protein
MKKQNRRVMIKTAVVYLFFALIMSCGYAFAPQGEYIDKRINNVYVQSFDNKTSEAELENYVRTAFIDQFILSGRFKVVQSEELADAIVKGVVLNIHTSAISYRTNNTNNMAAEERATMALAIDFREKDSGKTIWSSTKVSGQVDYKTEDNINILPTLRKDAYIKLSKDVAEKTFNMMMSGF